MAVINTKFSVGDIIYTFNASTGTIYRSIVSEINIVNKNSDIEVTYNLVNTVPAMSGRIHAGPEYEQNMHTEAEVKELANVWLMKKSLSIFSDAGL
jgi:hypothetical protein